MITVNMHEAKARLSELVKAVEERNEVVTFDRVLVALAQIHQLTILTSDERIPRFPGVGTCW